jgi:uncharacterized protein YrrD
VIVLTRGAVPETTVVVHGSAVQSYASDTLAIRSVTALRLVAHDTEASELIHRGLQFRGHTVLSGAGAKLGRIRSVLIDENGHVAEYRVRRGVFGFLRPARRVKPADLRASGGHVAVMWPSAEEDSSTPRIDDEVSAPERSNGSAKTDADQDPET